MIELEKNIHKIRMDLMSWILDTAPESSGSYKNWLREFHQKIKLKGKFSEDCCGNCIEQRMIDLFLLKFRQNHHIFTTLLNISDEGKPSILDLSEICERIDKGEIEAAITIVEAETRKLELKENVKLEVQHGKRRLQKLTSSSSDENDSNRIKRSNNVTEEIIQLAAETGRSTSFLSKREKVGKPAEYPIYYPDHPNVPRYWSVDDKFAFEELLELIPEEENGYKRAHKIQSFIGNGEQIPIPTISKRANLKTAKEKWTREETKKFIKLYNKYSSMELDNYEKNHRITEELGSKRSEEGVRKYLHSYEMSLEAIHKPVILPSFVDKKLQEDKSESSAFETNSNKRQKINHVTEEIHQLALDTGRSTSFLVKRKKVGNRAENPIYYPDYPEVPRYWGVDDMLAFEDLAESVGEDNIHKRARKVQELIKNGKSIPLEAIKKRFGINKLPRDEFKKFIHLAEKHKASQFDSKAERAQIIWEELSTERTRQAVNQHLATYEMCMESIRKPVILPKFSENMTNFSQNEFVKTKNKANNSNETLLFAEQTGRSVSFLRYRKRAGKLGENPIYYPDHPEVPRYWTVDDVFAFNELLDEIPEEENVYKRAKKVQGLIANGSSIPVSIIKMRIAGKASNVSRWTREESRRFFELAREHKASDFDSITERVKTIWEKMKTNRTETSISSYLARYEVCQESIRKPLILSDYDSAETSGDSESIYENDNNTSVEENTPSKQIKTEANFMPEDNLLEYSETSDDWNSFSAP